MTFYLISKIINKLFLYLIFEGQRLRGHQILFSFIYNLCSKIGIEEFKNAGVRDPCEVFISIIVTELLEKIVTDKIHNKTGLSLIFSLIDKMYKIEFLRCLTADKQIISLLEDLDINYKKIIEDLTEDSENLNMEREN